MLINKTNAVSNVTAPCCSWMNIFAFMINTRELRLRKQAAVPDFYRAAKGFGYCGITC